MYTRETHLFPKDMDNQPEKQVPRWQVPRWQVPKWQVPQIEVIVPFGPWTLL